MIPQVADIHTHNPMADDAVISLPPPYGPMRPGALYSVGCHPWEAEPRFDLVEALATHPQVVMIGECGLDRVRGALSMEQQLELLRRHVELSERVGKPLLLHVVKAWAELLALHAAMRPRQPWIVHGFRGNPQLARQLLRAGFYLSVHPLCPPATLAVIPPDRLLHETD